MKKVKCHDIEDARNKLKNWSMATKENRQWLCATPKDSYDDESYRIEICILEGSPVKAIAVINHSEKKILVLDNQFYKELLFTWAPEDQ